MMERGKAMRSKKRWIITSAAALLLAAGGATAFVASAAAPMTHEETLKRTEEKFGKPPAPPTGDELKEQLAKVEATMQAKPGDDPQKPQDASQKAQDDWQKAELLKQQITMAEHAPSPMPTGHDSYSVAGNKP
jgi:hypothetical protein